MLGRTKENHPKFGKFHTEETITKMSKTHSGKLISKQTKIKISVTKGTKIYVYSFDKLELIYTFSSARKAVEFFFCN